MGKMYQSKGFLVWLEGSNGLPRSGESHIETAGIV